MNNLAFTWKSLSRDREAIDLMRNVVDLSTKLLGSQHPDTIDSTESLDDWTS